ncbi:MAG: DegV family protein [Faecalibacterium sp.]|nr:DegV family protein [Faecalibacterium sp.]
MVSIVSDTSTLYSPAEAKAEGFRVSPLSVTIAGETYKEYVDMDSARFVSIIKQGNIPTSSQPSVGDVSAVYEELKGEPILNIAMADGLSGTYQSAVTAANLCEGADIQVVNSRTLCGPHRYMVETAVALAKQGLSREAIMERIQPMIDTSKSYLLPSDFVYLRRGGRLSPLVSYVGQLAKLVPVMTLTEDCKQLTSAGIKRGFKQAVEQVIKLLQPDNLDSKWRIYISHAENTTLAEQARELVSKAFPDAEVQVVKLSCAFCTQGGPDCVAIQTVLL